MEGIIIIALFSLQLISFFFIVILFAKLNKFKELEKKQEQIVEEMDAALGAYLMEMKEENDRLIEQLSTIPKPAKDAEQKVQPPLAQVPNFVSSTAASTVYKKNIEKQTQLEEASMLTPNSTFVEPQAGQAVKGEPIVAISGEQAVDESEQLEEVKEHTYEENVVKMYKAGKSVEEIAKNLNKGKTEIELLIKFHT